MKKAHGSKILKQVNGSKESGLKTQRQENGRSSFQVLTTRQMAHGSRIRKLETGHKAPSSKTPRARMMLLLLSSQVRRIRRTPRTRLILLPRLHPLLQARTMSIRKSSQARRTRTLSLSLRRTKMLILLSSLARRIRKTLRTRMMLIQRLLPLLQARTISILKPNQARRTKSLL